MKKLLILLLLVPSLSSTNISIAKTVMPEDQINYGIKQCKNDKQQFNASKMTIGNYNTFCECYIKSMMNLLDEKEMSYQQKYQTPSQNFINSSQRVKSNCIK